MQRITTLGLAMGRFVRDFIRFIGYAAVGVAVGLTVLQWLIMEMNQCGPNKISIGILGHGVYCFTAEKWYSR